MHWLDRASAFAVARTPQRRRPFARGWGDLDAIAFHKEEANRALPLVETEVEESAPRESNGLLIRDLEFDSPDEYLPPASQRVRAIWVGAEPEPARVVILHAAWNDEDYRARMRVARDLVPLGVGAVIPQHPFYGERRREPDIEHPISYVSDFGVMGRSAVLEGRVLAEHLRRRGRRVGVSGFSMGGNIAGFVISTTGFPVAGAPLAAAYSPGPAFTDGVLRHTIAWDALGGDTPDVIDRLSEYVHTPSILAFEAPRWTAAATLVAGTRDGFVPTATTLAIHRHWPGSKMDWVNAGHASLLLRNRPRLVAAIVDSFDRLEAM